jgi:hypothetical protein
MVFGRVWGLGFGFGFGAAAGRIWPAFSWSWRHSSFWFRYFSSWSWGQGGLAGVGF